MDQATQQNAALVEEMAAAANGLKNQAQDLVQAVAVFKLDTNAQVRTSPLASNSPRPPERASNVAQLRPQMAPRTALPQLAKTGTDDWGTF